MYTADRQIDGQTCGHRVNRKKDEDDGHLDQLPFYEVTVYEVLAMSILKWMKNMCLPLHPERNTDNANKQRS